MSKLQTTSGRSVRYDGQDLIGAETGTTGGASGVARSTDEITLTLPAATVAKPVPPEATPNAALNVGAFSNTVLPLNVWVVPVPPNVFEPVMVPIAVSVKLTPLNIREPVIVAEPTTFKLVILAVAAFTTEPETVPVVVTPANVTESP